MGPFPHDAAQAEITAHNPMGTDGFEFVEYAHPNPAELHTLFRSMGFTPVARHRSKAITLYRQGDINYVVNEEPGSHGANFVAAHGPCAPAMAFRVVDAQRAFERALSLGAEAADPAEGSKTLDVPAIKGIGGSLLCFVDQYGTKGSPYEADFEWVDARDPKPAGVGLYYLDHLTHNVHRGRMDVWSGFYERLFNFKQIRFFDIEGKLTGLFSKALTSPTAKSASRSMNRRMRKARSRNTCTPIMARVSSTSPAAAATSTPQSKRCAAITSPSCRRRRKATSRASRIACPGMASRSPVSRRTAS